MTDRSQEGLRSAVTLVVALNTFGGEELIERLRAKAPRRAHLFIAVVPQQTAAATRRARRARLQAMLEKLRGAGLLARA